MATPNKSTSMVPNISEEFALIPAGIFQMGDQSNQLHGIADGLPVHPVKVGAFYLAKHELTKSLWDKVRTWATSHGYKDLEAGQFPWECGIGKADDHPVCRVSWYQAIEWCNARSEMEGLHPCYTINGAVMKTGVTQPVVDWSANGYRLPTEAEWENAARGGLKGKNFPWGNSISGIKGNFIDTTGSDDQTYAKGDEPYTSPVGSFVTNGYGLFDMAGNVAEWCWDWYGAYGAEGQTDPRGPVAGRERVNRGGGWIDEVHYCSVAFREMRDPQFLGLHIGFRLARSVIP
jgi:formylglycine-generating enzyme required for sulfatase activity